ncbi:hypothetical protein I6N90_00810 [Paenibacillus sp. GSMTC-2017]|uniref:hypothetical protein n=1 Tax=Paenibacillus sp. GSMTC-2017 TaxID=2794350 RepID=UPI0018D9DF64|nr:hypothetical protein [Paenibacillus sp. GSMTC-2017]MBH5316345.1 hypothetical protein [Paenibacillus sp. GSMTC-2017]
MEQGFVDRDDIEHRVRGNVKKNVSRIAESLFVTLIKHQILVIRNCWEHITFHEKSIAELDQEIEAHLEQYQEEHNLLQTIPGVSSITASAIIIKNGSSFLLDILEQYVPEWIDISRHHTVYVLPSRFHQTHSPQLRVVSRCNTYHR